MRKMMAVKKKVRVLSCLVVILVLMSATMTAFAEPVSTTSGYATSFTINEDLDSKSEMKGVFSIVNDIISRPVKAYGVGLEVYGSEIPTSDGFDYPVGETGYVTEDPDGDGWYNAQDFGVPNPKRGNKLHLGEDWNGEDGGDSDCGLPVYASSKGTIVYAENAGSGWGNVIIVRHRLPDGTLLESLYGHLQGMSKTSGTVERREQIGTIGKAGGSPCHLHFEVRFSNCPSWGRPGPGYSYDTTGWTDPSDFIESHRQLSSADLNCDGRVDPADFAILLIWWRKNPSEATSCCKSPDIDGDGNVDPVDFANMMVQWTG